MAVRLSYIITTFNKAKYLKLTLPLLIENCKSDEEIVVTDGGSTDGSREYLEILFKEGKIHQFISEKDYGEAHGYNKAMLMAKGSLVKFITDDDAFNYPGIALCREFMEGHTEIDLLATNGVGGITNEDAIVHFGFDGEFKKWLSNKTPFTFPGLGLMIRKSSIPLIGLLNPAFRRVDAEFGFRVTSSKCRMAWYTGSTWFHVGNDSSNSHKYEDEMESEMLRLLGFYMPIQKKMPKHTLAKIFHKSKRILFGNKTQQAGNIQRVPFEKAVETLAHLNEEGKKTFLH